MQYILDEDQFFSPVIELDDPIVFSPMHARRPDEWFPKEGAHHSLNWTCTIEKEGVQFQFYWINSGYVDHPDRDEGESRGYEYHDRHDIWQSPWLSYRSEADRALALAKIAEAEEKARREREAKEAEESSYARLKREAEEYSSLCKQETQYVRYQGWRYPVESPYVWFNSLMGLEVMLPWDIFLGDAQRMRLEDIDIVRMSSSFRAKWSKE